MLEKREMIIGFAMERFAFFGIYKTTLDEIANASGYRLPSLYHYFPSKEFLVIAVYEKIYSEYMNGLLSIHNPLDRIELKLKKIIGLRHKFLKKYFMLNLWDSNPQIPYSEGQAKDYLISIKDREVEYLKGIFIDSMNKKEILTVEPIEFAKLFIDSISGLMAVAIIPLIKTPNLIKDQLASVYRQQIRLLVLFVNATR